MSTKTEIEEKLTSDHYSRIEILSKVPDWMDIRFLMRDGVAVNADSYEDMIHQLSLLRETLGNWSLSGYYMNNGSLNVDYSFRGITVAFFIPDVEHALKKISGGKCKIVEKTTTNLEVSCELS